MTFETTIFSKLYDRYTNSMHKNKRISYSIRINQAPTVLVIASKVVGFFLSRFEFADQLILKIPGVKLFVRFLYGNAQLIWNSSEDVEVNSISREYVDTSGTFDVVVVGSGPGGSIAALRASETSKKVLVIESGSAYAPTSI